MAQVAHVFAVTISFDPIQILIWLLIGLVAGFLASRVVRGGGLGLIGNIVVGLLGALIGGFLANFFGIGNSFGWLGTLVIAFLGACLLLFILRIVTGSKRR